MTMADEPLLVVTDTFNIEGRGIVLTPSLASYRGAIDVQVRLERPDNSTVETSAHIGLTHFNRGALPGLWEWVVQLRGVQKDAVPVGTRLFLMEK